MVVAIVQGLLARRRLVLEEAAPVVVLLQEAKLLRLGAPRSGGSVDPLVVGLALRVRHAAPPFDHVHLLLALQALLSVALDALQLADLPQLVLLGLVPLVV